MAALLAYRLEATLSHRSAAALWGLLPYPAAAPAWVIVRPERYARRPHIHATRARLEQSDVRMRFGMRVTSPPRTILDLAALIDDSYELERIAAEAAYRRLASEAELRDQLQRNPHKRGSAKLRVVVDLPGGPKRTRSAAERAMLQLLRENGIAGFETNARVTDSRSTSCGDLGASPSRSTAGTLTRAARRLRTTAYSPRGCRRMASP